MKTVAGIIGAIFGSVILGIAVGLLAVAGLFGHRWSDRKKLYPPLKSVD